MISYITGVPGAGKTYKALIILFANFAKNKKLVKDSKYKLPNVEYALTNINELDLSKFDNVYSIDWTKFYNSLNQLHTYKDVYDDTKLKEMAKELNILNCLIILDECHNYLDKQDKVLIWWLSYHRHLHHEIILITQNLSLVHSKYKAFSEFFYKAIPTSLRLFSSVMKYNQYPTSRMTNNLKTGVVKIPVYKEIFETYSSGNNHKSKSIIKKFLFLFIFLISIPIASIYFYKDSKTKEPEPIKNETEIKKDNSIPQTQTNQNIVPAPQPIENKSLDLSNKKYMKLVCKKGLNYCLHNKQRINLSFYSKMKDLQNFEQISVTQLNTGFVEIEIFASEDFYNIYNPKKEVQNDFKNNVLNSAPNISAVR